MCDLTVTMYAVLVDLLSSVVPKCVNLAMVTPGHLRAGAGNPAANYVISIACGLNFSRACLQCLSSNPLCCAA